MSSMQDWGSKRDGVELTTLGSEPNGIVGASGPLPLALSFARGSRLDAALFSCRLTVRHALAAAALGGAFLLGYVHAHPHAGSAGSAGPAASSRTELDLPPTEQPLDVRGERILMDFGIVGFNRCGTTSVQDWIQGVGDQVVIKSHDDNKFKKKHISHFARKINKHIEHRAANIDGVTSGIKSPSLMSSRDGPIALAKDFNSTKLIINIRHPISWFQSVYNAQLHKRVSKDSRRQLLSDPWGQVGCKHAFTEKACTDNAEYHRYLARLSKTDLGEDERRALRRYACRDGTEDCGLTDDHNILEPAPFGGKIFLIETSQLLARRDDLRRDLGDYLGLDLPDMTPLSNKGYGFDGAVDICEERYADIRGVLLVHAARASRWIVDYFLRSPDVVVSSRDYLVGTLEDWKNDPCDSREGRDLMETGEAYA